MIEACDLSLGGSCAYVPLSNGIFEHADRESCVDVHKLCIVKYIVMTISDLIFLFSALFALALVIGIVVSALRRRFTSTARLASILAAFLAAYALALVVVAMATPRRFYAPGERRCFDDWCVAVTGAAPGNDAACSAGVGRNWIASIEVSSVARRVRQRAPDARAEMEDQDGKRYSPCAAASPSLGAELGPGESFRVDLPFKLPEGSNPAGLIVHHGEFPGVIIVGADESFRHPPALHRLR